MGNSSSSGANGSASGGSVKTKIQAVATLSLAGKGNVSEVTEVTEIPVSNSMPHASGDALPTFGSPAGEDLEVEELDGASESGASSQPAAPLRIMPGHDKGKKKKKKQEDTRPMSEWSEVELLRNVVPASALHQP